MKKDPTLVLGFLLLIFPAGLATAQLDAPQGDRALDAHCPDVGVELLEPRILDIGSQTCPAVRVGPGIPFVGQLEIFSIGSRRCPVIQYQFPPYHVPVEKSGFRLERGESLTIERREVSCSSAQNLLVIGTSGCSYGSWQSSPARVVDWEEDTCD